MFLSDDAQGYLILALEFVEVSAAAQEMGMRRARGVPQLVKRECGVDGTRECCGVDRAAQGQKQGDVFRSGATPRCGEPVTCGNAPLPPLPVFDPAVSLVEVRRDLVAQPRAEVNEERDRSDGENGDVVDAPAGEAVGVEPRKLVIDLAGGGFQI